MNEVKFTLRRNATVDPMIKMALRHNGKKFVYSTGLSVAEKHWDKGKMRVSHKYGKHPIYNAQLNRFLEAIIKAYESFEDIGINPSNAQLKSKLEEYLEVNSRKDLREAVEIKPYIDSYIMRIKAEGDLARGTIQGFNQLVCRWSDFSKGYGKSLTDLDIDTLKAFQTHMKDYGYSQSQREKIQRKLVTILRYAETADNVRVHSAYKLNYWKVGVPRDSVKIVMSNNEIKRIRDFDFPLGSKLDRVRDRWIIGFATGQRYSDFKDINSDKIRESQGRKYLEVIQQKTGKVVNVPLYDDVQIIFEKYNGKPPVFSDQKFNNYIKEVARKVGIDNIVTKILQITPNDKKITQHPKYELVTSHICRRSFATNGSLKGLSMGYLMEITGHRKAQTFLDYIHLDKRDLPVNLPQGNSIFN